MSHKWSLLKSSKRGAILIASIEGAKNFFEEFDKDFSTTNSGFSYGSSWIGWFTAYLANVFLIKLQGLISPGRTRDRINPNGAF